MQKLFKNILNVGKNIILLLNTETHCIVMDDYKSRPDVSIDESFNP